MKIEYDIEQDEYGSYYARYIRYSNGNDLLALLRDNAGEISVLLDTLTDEELLYRYEAGKWSLKEVFGHMIDTERIFGYRALAIARGEKQPLPGYDQDQYVAESRFDEWPAESLKRSYRLTREATLDLFSGFDEQMLMKQGTVDGYPCSVRAAGYIIAGHEIHHLGIIAGRYLPDFPEAPEKDG